MERPIGKPLGTWLKDKHQFETNEVISIGMQICNALDYAHQAGVVHKNIKADTLF